MRLNISIHAERAGILVANNGQYPLIVAHLYNALRQLGILPRRWPALEQFIEIQSKNLMLGELPPKVLMAKLELALGFPASVISRVKQSTGRDKRDIIHLPAKLPNAVDGATRGKPSVQRMAVQPVSKTFYNVAQGTRSLNDAMSLLQNQLSQTSGARTKGWTETTHATLPQFLADIQATFPAILSAIKFDYIGLTLDCGELLDRLAREEYLNVMTRASMARSRATSKTEGKSTSKAKSQQKNIRDSKPDGEETVLEIFDELEALYNGQSLDVVIEAERGPQLEVAAGLMTEFLHSKGIGFVGDCENAEGKESEGEKREWRKIWYPLLSSWWPKQTKSLQAWCSIPQNSTSPSA